MIEFARFADYAPPLIGAVLAGGLIGFEREYHRRAAGFRTHSLVAMGAALFTVGAAGSLSCSCFMDGGAGSARRNRERRR